jgi:hypothetical protein
LLSAAIMVVRTLLSVMSYVRCLSCSQWDKVSRTQFVTGCEVCVVV